MMDESMRKDQKAAIYNSALASQRCSIPDLCDIVRTTSGSLLALIDTDDALERRALQQALDLPSDFWSSTLQESSGFFRAREVVDETGTASSYDTWFRFLVKIPRKADCPKRGSNTIIYRWIKLCFFTRWQPDGTSLVFAFDLSTHLHQDIQELGLEEKVFSSPFSVHNLLLDIVCPVFDTAVWACRDLVREAEKQRPSPERPQLEYENLHEIARHAIHSTEMLATAINVVEAMIEEQRDRAQAATCAPAEREARRSLKFHQTLLQGFHLRSKALESRLTNEMNLTFHVNAQYDSVVQGRIAKSAQSDSAAMRTISFLGLIFLPGTFISAIFSMSFFDFSPDSGTQQFRMSSSFWVFWAVSIPVTLITILLWTLWYRSVQSADKFPLPPGKEARRNREDNQKTRSWPWDSGIRRSSRSGQEVMQLKSVC